MFDGKKYLHRSSNQGDRLAAEFYEDLFESKKSKTFNEYVESGECVLNTANIRRGIKARRGDGTFGESLPKQTPIVVVGFAVSRGAWWERIVSAERRRAAEIVDATREALDPDDRDQDETGELLASLAREIRGG
jgi:hypothetical protein